jgi:PAS domain S-box-containing protein
MHDPNQLVYRTNFLGVMVLKLITEELHFFKTIVENSALAIIVIDRDGRLVYVNPAHEKLFGRPLEEAKRLNYRDYFSPESIEILENHVTAILARGESWEGQLKAFDKRGRELIIWEHAGSIFDQSGEMLYSFAIMADLTERKRAEYEIQESQRKYDQLFDLESDALFLVDKETSQILDVNRAAVDLYGYSREELINMKKNHLSAEPEKTQTAIKEYIRKAQTRWHRKKDGTVFAVEITGAYFICNGKEVQLAAVRHITERLSVEQVIRGSENRWEFALEGAGDGIWDWNPITNHVYYSKQWKTMLGYSDQEIGDTLDEWDLRVHPEDKAGVYVELERHFRGETEIYQSEHRLLCKDRSYKWILVRGKVIERTEDGKPNRVIGTHTDITGRKEIEEELTRRRNSLENLVKERTQELEKKTEDLQGMNAALKVLLKQREDDKKEIAERYLSNIKNLILPYMEKLTKICRDERQISYLEIMQGHFDEILSPLMSNFQHFNLTPMEIQVASLIKNGKSTKEIAKLMTISTATVDNHRKSIRKKIGLNKIKANLQVKLNSINE